MVTGEINSLEGIRADSLKIAEDHPVELRLMLSPADLRYVFYSPESKAVIRMGVIPSENRSWSKSSLHHLFSELKKDLPLSGKVFCSFNGLPFVVVPSVLADKSLFSSLLGISHGESEQSISERKLSTSEAVLVYRMPETWKEVLNDVFPAALTDVHCAELIEHTIGRQSKSKKQAVSVNLGADFLDVVVCNEQSKLVFANSFSVGSSEDCLYYLSSIAESLSIDLQNADMLIQGDIASDDLLHRSLSKYFPGLKMKRLHPELLADGFPEQVLASLLGPELCG